MNGKISDREKKHERLWTPGSKRNGYRGVKNTVTLGKLLNLNYLPILLLKKEYWLTFR